ncbi:serine/threonine-protein kinase EDR1-like [Hibiscus syriacus]|uniref:Serine/threonine-protein kinase EDR1-like n=1 Tax=Hibiscus syriacus TaxID=106335 RepID=A0A6A3D0Z0_HIBSY|nr:putative [ribosomal protein S5]-alanine N-acetyltransferase [Hibiscus syriacus]KAE8733418.1 serine/threonine-protein kinase EDR1-like [Hibiscus syriacus]
MEIDMSKITLRPFKLEDADDFLLFAGDDQFTENLRWKTLASKQEALDHIKDVCIPHPWRRSICIDDRSIGFVSIFPFSGDEDKHKANFGYGVAVKYWGHGIATKAAKLAVSRFFLDFPEVVRLEAYVDVENLGSQKVVEKAGFQKEGLLRKYAFIKGKSRDLVLYSFCPLIFLLLQAKVVIVKP